MDAEQSRTLHGLLSVVFVFHNNYGLEKEDRDNDSNSVGVVDWKTEENR